jgi:anti-anti-sigma factor
MTNGSGQLGRVERDWPVEGLEVITLVGELGVESALELRRALVEAVEEAEELVVDVSALASIDASTLGMLADAARIRRMSGRRVAVVVSDENLAKLLHLTTLDQVLDVCGSTADVFRAPAVAVA